LLARVVVVARIRGDPRHARQHPIADARIWLTSLISETDSRAVVGSGYVTFRHQSSLVLKCPASVQSVSRARLR
jgi:hypothetical protein